MQQKSYIIKIMYTSTLLNKNKEYYLYTMLYITFIILTPKNGMGFDMTCWSEWSIFIFNNGLENIYNSHADYPPLYLYILEFFGWLKGSEEAIRKSIYQLKYLTLLFEFGSIFILFKYINKSERPWFFLFILLNPGFFYNSIIWGQVDGILAFLLLSSVVLALSRKNFLALIVFVLSINFKVQSIIFLPLLLFILIHNISDYKGLQYSLFVILAIISLQILLIAPYLSETSSEQLFSTMLQSVDKYPAISKNAYNWWYWFWDNNQPSHTTDSETWLSISYKSWGLILFFTTSIAALVPVFAMVLKEALAKNKDYLKHIDKIFLSAGIVPILFFFCNTQMHERYSHYGLIFLAAFVTVSGNYLPFILLSIAYFLNLESVLEALPFSNHAIVLFNADFIAAIYFSLIVYLYFLIYKKSHFENNIKEVVFSLQKKKIV